MGNTALTYGYRPGSSCPTLHGNLGPLKTGTDGGKPYCGYLIKLRTLTPDRIRSWGDEFGKDSPGFGELVRWYCDPDTELEHARNQPWCNRKLKADDLPVEASIPDGLADEVEGEGEGEAEEGEEDAAATAAAEIEAAAETDARKRNVRIAMIAVGSIALMLVLAVVAYLAYQYA